MPYSLKGNCVIKFDTGETVKCHDDHASALAHLRALMANVPDAKESTMPTETNLNEATFSTDERKKLADSGAAMSDGSYPIRNAGDLQNAIHAIGRGSAPHEDIKAHIIKRARALGLTKSLPEDWNVKESSMTRKTGYLLESSDFTEAQLDAAEYVAKGVTLIKPGFSTNTDKQGRARYYSPEVLKQSIGVFEGTRSFRNHPTKTEKSDRPERDVRDITGYYTDVMQSSDGSLKANYHVVGEARQWLWPMIEETVKSKPDLLATSINALGETSIGKVQEREAVIVESIKHSNSVDVVTTAGAGGSFAGALLHDNGDEFTADLLKAMSFEEWREARPDYLDKLKNELKTARNEAALKEVKDSNESLTKQLADLQEAHRAADDELAKYRRVELADRLLAESTLPLKLRETVKADLLKEADEDAMRKAMERETAKYAAAPKPRVDVQPVGERKAIPAAAPKTEKVSVMEAATELLQAGDIFKALPGESMADYQKRRAQAGL